MQLLISIYCKYMTGVYQVHFLLYITSETAWIWNLLMTCITGSYLCNVPTRPTIQDSWFTVWPQRNDSDRKINDSRSDCTTSLKWDIVSSLCLHQFNCGACQGNVMLQYSYLKINVVAFYLFFKLDFPSKTQIFLTFLFLACLFPTLCLGSECQTQH